MILCVIDKWGSRVLGATMEVKKVLAEEGRDAKNVLLYHLSAGDDASLQSSELIRNNMVY